MIAISCQNVPVIPQLIKFGQIGLEESMQKNMSLCEQDDRVPAVVIKLSRESPRPRPRDTAQGSKYRQPKTLPTSPHDKHKTP